MVSSSKLTVVLLSEAVLPWSVYTSGLPKDLVRSCLHISPDRGQRLCYGSILVTNSKHALLIWRKHWIGQWLKLRTQKHYKPSLSFWGVAIMWWRILHTSMNWILSSNMKILVMKLPYKLRERWRTNVWKLQERQNSRLQFSEYFEFIERQVRVASDPFFKF